jgi:hypothetical protein
MHHFAANHLKKLLLIETESMPSTIFAPFFEQKEK